MTMQALRETKQTATIACPSGFTAGGTACGIKSSGADDLALILCPNGATAAAVFTQNLVRAAPITLSQAMPSLRLCRPRANYRPTLARAH